MKAPKILMLGASLAQIPGILAAQKVGIEVVSCDNQPTSPGHALADMNAHASTFDPPAVLEVAKKYDIAGIMTMGSDQPVLTATLVAKQLGLPSALSVETALAVTDKRVMKRTFKALGLPSLPFVIVRPDQWSDQPSDIKPKHQLEDLPQLQYPVVVKPVDSQGQRGIRVCKTPEAVRQCAPEVLRYSRTDEILVETYYPSDEVTVSGWVVDGKATILTLTDRVSFPSMKQLGICLSHEWPSRHLPQFGPEISDLTQEIVSGFGITQGPIYFQFLIGRNGIQINEIACRIGGAFESQFIPHLTGFDLTKAQIALALGLPLDPASLEILANHDFKQVYEHLSVQLFFANPCTITNLTPLEEILACPGVLDAGYHLKPGDTLASIENATARVGYCIVTATEKTQLEQRLTKLYQVLKVLDQQGVNQVIHRPLEENAIAEAK